MSWFADKIGVGVDAKSLDRNLTGKPSAGNPLIVGITGGSGSGKTTFAERLRARFGSHAAVLSHDDYYKNLPGMTAEEAAAYDFDCPEAFDTYLLVKHLRDLKAGRSVAIPSYDFATHTRTDAAHTIEPAPVIIVEGLLIMCDSELLDLFDLVVYMDADTDTATRRRIERDCRERGATLQYALDMYNSTVKPAYEMYIEPFKHKADVIVADAMDDQSLETVVNDIRSIAGHRPV